MKKLLASGEEIIVTTAILAVLGALIWTIAWSIANDHRGTYAGWHYNDAQSYVRNVMVSKYGPDMVSKMQFADPPVINTHLNNLLTGTGQVRVFHIIDAQGKKYCVSIWGGGNGPNDHNQIKEGCVFNAARS